MWFASLAITPSSARAIRYMPDRQVLDRMEAAQPLGFAASKSK
jgi:hypothetical protein